MNFSFTQKKNATEKLLFSALEYLHNQQCLKLAYFNNQRRLKKKKKKKPAGTKNLVAAFSINICRTLFLYQRFLKKRWYTSRITIVCLKPCRFSLLAAVLQPPLKSHFCAHFWLIFYLLYWELSFESKKESRSPMRIS